MLGEISRTYDPYPYDPECLRIGSCWPQRTLNDDESGTL